jgi:threonine 3-dehydrogenase
MANGSNQSMRAIVKETDATGFVTTTMPVPGLRPNDILVKVETVAICGSDRHVYNWDEFASTELGIKLPMIVGHEFSGRVVAVGSHAQSDMKGTPLQVDNHISAESHVFCGKCLECARGDLHLCRHTRILGLSRDGCFAEFVAIPQESVWVHDRWSVPSRVAATYEPFGNCVHVADTVGVKGRNILVIGAGPMGLLSTIIWRAEGAAKIIVADTSAYRLSLAKTAGATKTIETNCQNSEFTQQILDETSGDGVDVVLEMSGDHGVVAPAMRATRLGGLFVYFGIPSKRIPNDTMTDGLVRGLRTVAVLGRRVPDTWEKTDRLLQEPHICNKVTQILTHTFSLEDYDKGFSLMERGICGKVLLEVT